MSGASWEQRQPTDWLASNGRWYPSGKYPRGWSRSALPPAPDHGGVGSIIRKYADIAATSVGSPTPSTPTPTSPSTAKPSAGPPSNAVVQTGRGVADATVTAQRTYAPPVAAGAPPPPALGTSADLPAPPGRISEEEVVRADPTQPPVPTKVKTPYIPPPSGSNTSGSETSGSFNVVAGDLGRVLGSARRRIEKAINDSASS